MNWKNYQESTKKSQPNYLTIYANHNFVFQTVIDFGCGSGSDSVYLVKHGKKVLAIDQLLEPDYFYSRLPKKYYSSLMFLEGNFEEMRLPKADCVVGLFSLSFCNPSHFEKVWNQIYSSLNSHGVFVGNLFGDRDYRKNRTDINTFTKEEVLNLLKDYDIKKWKEQEYIRDSDSTHWHYFDFVVTKK